MRVHGIIKWLVSALSRCWSGIFLSNYHLEICCFLEEISLVRNLKIYGLKTNRSRKASEELARRTRTRLWFVTLVFFQVREDARIWAHKNLYLKASDPLKASSSGFFPEHTVPYFWSPPLISFKGCWRSTACNGHDVIFVEIAGKCQFPVSRVPS